MVDFQSQAKIHGYRYTRPEIRYPTPNVRTKRQAEPLCFTTPRTRAHDCRLESATEHHASPDWEAFILATGVKKTYEAVRQQHHKEKHANEDGIVEPDKLLCDSLIRGRPGKCGSGPGELNQPRGVTSTPDGDIIVADTLNHRVQIFNSYALFKAEFGRRGKGPGEFNQPTDVAVMRNGRIVVADSKNKRVQVFTDDLRFKYMFSTSSEPYYVTCDRNHNMVVSTLRRTIEVYRRQGALRHKFELPHQGNPLCAPIVANPDREEVMICDVADGKIKVYNYSGQELSSFQPQTSNEALALQPCSITVSAAGHILVADNLNHCINAYDARGTFLAQVLNASDSVGPVVACTVGPQGHLILTEYSLNGVHCVKVFRYEDCDCHRARPGSAKKAPRDTSPPTRVVAPSPRKD